MHIICYEILLGNFKRNILVLNFQLKFPLKMMTYCSFKHLHNLTWIKLDFMRHEIFIILILNTTCAKN